MNEGGITRVPGVQAGHYTDREAATGCTVVICEKGAVGGVAVRGSAPGTRETDLLRPTNLVTEVHAVVLSGGSAFGLDAASGAVQYLEERGIGLAFGGATVPIVPAAILFDLGLVTGSVRPGSAEGYRACQNASARPLEEGSVGAGTGATVAKLLGPGRSVKGGFGTASADLGEGLVVGAAVAVNALGGIFDPDTGDLVAGPRGDDGVTMQHPAEVLASPGYRPGAVTPSNTTIGVVATNGPLDKEQANKLASVAHDGLALAVRPAHTMNDGDTIFALATGELEGPIDLNRILAASTWCLSSAILRGVRSATGIGGIPGIREFSDDGAQSAVQDTSNGGA